MSGVARDGSPVDVYLALPPGDTPELIHRAVRAGATLLELGSGPGRLTHHLAARGHEVVAVDDSAEMLAHVRGAETVLADLDTLDLGRTFDAVVLASHLVDDPDPQRRHARLAVCARHTDQGGTVIVERYDPDWVRTCTESTGTIGAVRIRLHDVQHAGDELTAAVTYELDGRAWTQRFTAFAVDDDLLVAEAEEVGLRFDRWLDDARLWARFTRGS